MIVLFIPLECVPVVACQAFLIVLVNFLGDKMDNILALKVRQSSDLVEINIQSKIKDEVSSISSFVAFSY